MISIFIVGLISCLQFLFVLLMPIMIVYLSLLTGPLPLRFGEEQFINIGFGDIQLPTLRIFGLWLAVFIVIILYRKKTIRYFTVYKFHLLFVVFFTFAIIWSPSAIYGLRMVAKLSLPLMFLLLVLVTVNNASQLKVLERIIVGSAIISIFTALITHSPESKLFSITGMSAAPFSAHLVVVSMLLIAQAIFDKRPVTLVLLTAVILAIIAAYTRITIGGLFIGAAVLLFIGMRGLARLTLPGVVIIGLPALFMLSDRFRSRMFSGSDTVSFRMLVDDPITVMAHVHGSGRFDMWETVLDIYFKPSPIIGSGAGATQHYFYYIIPDTELGVIHSEYIRMISEVGILGVLLFAITIMWYIICLIKIYLNNQHNKVMKYPLAAIGSITSYLVFFATDNGIDYVLQLGIYVFVLIGMSIKATEIVNKESSVNRIRNTNC